MAEARQHAAAVCAGLHETARSPSTDIGHGRGELRKIDQAWWADATIASVVTSGVLGQMAAELLGVDTIRLWHDQLLWKPPGGGREGVVGWHQDRAYWTASSTSDMVTAWVALDDVTADMGAMRFVPGSHRWGRVVDGNAFFEKDHESQRARARLPDGAEWREDLVEVQAGQATFHHCKTLHGSAANISDRPRISLAVHLISGDARRVPGQVASEQRLRRCSRGRALVRPRSPRPVPLTKAKSDDREGDLDVARVALE